MYLEIKNLVKYYGEDRSRVQVLKGINCSMEKGQICVLLGPSGSGKSTLLNIVGDIEEFDEGEIIVDGKSMVHMSKREVSLYRRNNLGFVFQFYNLIPNLSVKENIEVCEYLSKKPLDIDDLIKTLGLWEHKDKFPNQLSGGQQMTASIGSSANMCIIAAILIYISLMYILTKIVIDKNSLYISYMKVFGYEAKEIRRLYLHATTVVVILSLIVGLPLDYLALKYCFIVGLAKVNGYMEMYIPAYLFAAIVAVGIVVYVLINLMHMKRINKISMADALKNRE